MYLRSYYVIPKYMPRIWVCCTIPQIMPKQLPRMAVVLFWHMFWHMPVRWCDAAAQNILTAYAGTTYYARAYWVLCWHARACIGELTACALYLGPGPCLGVTQP